MAGYNNSRHLITTADERTWKFDRPVLFLGEWCRRYSRYSEWDRLDAKFVPEYGGSLKQNNIDFDYVSKLSERLLVELKCALNRYHGTDYSQRYWRILIGPWLLTFTSIAYNRWATIQLAQRNFCISRTSVLNLPVQQTTPYSFNDFAHKYWSHTWNQHIFSRIIRMDTEISVEEVSSQHPGDMVERVVQCSLNAKLKHRGRKLLSSMLGLFCRTDEAFIINSYLPRIQEFKLYFSLGQIPKFWLSRPAPKIEANVAIRSAFDLSNFSSNRFEQCLRGLIAEQLPTIYLEGYQTLVRSADELPWPSKPRVIFTSNNFQADDVFKAWVAAKSERGVPYVIGQHGGVYGCVKYPTPAEINEVATADRYLTWGWTDGNKKHYPCAALKLVGIPQRKWDPQGGLVQVTLCELRYTREPWGNVTMQKKYLADRFKFTDALSPAIREFMTIRLHPADARNGRKEDIDWIDRYPNMRLDYGHNKMETLIRKSRLVIQTYNSTGILETLGSNVPTIMFWDPSFNELRSNAQPYFELLRKVGIFHETPTSAAAKVNEIWSDVVSWWEQKSLQAARREFCLRFVCRPAYPIRVIKTALTTVKNVGEAKRDV